jgi:hypothetical protein
MDLTKKYEESLKAVLFISMEGVSDWIEHLYEKKYHSSLNLVPTIIRFLSCHYKPKA